MEINNRTLAIRSYFLRRSKEFLSTIVTALVSELYTWFLSVPTRSILLLLSLILYWNISGEWGFPFDELDLRLLAKCYLDHSRIEMPQLRDNLPGTNWAKSFLKRHAKSLSLRTASNISRKRAAVSKPILDEFFENAKDDLEGRSLCNTQPYLRRLTNENEKSNFSPL